MYFVRRGIICNYVWKMTCFAFKKKKKKKEKKGLKTTELRQSLWRRGQQIHGNIQIFLHESVLRVLGGGDQFPAQKYGEICCRESGHKWRMVGYYTGLFGKMLFQSALLLLFLQFCKCLRLFWDGTQISHNNDSNNINSNHSHIGALQLQKVNPPWLDLVGFERFPLEPREGHMAWRAFAASADWTSVCLISDFLIQPTLWFFKHKMSGVPSSEWWILFF